MAKDTRIAFRASADLKRRLQRASKKLKLGETALAEAAVEAAVEYIEQHGGIWFPLRVVPDPAQKKTPELPEPAITLTGIHAPDVVTANPSPSSARFSVNEDAPQPSKQKPFGPRARSTRAGIKKLVERSKPTP